MKRTLLLVILDGFGIGPHQATNAIYLAEPKNLDHIRQNYPAGALQASGISVGLPWNEEGNSEVGHLTLGAGRVIYQHYPRITLAIRDESFYENKVLKAAAEHVKKNGSALHFAGLLTAGNVHASFEHLTALLEFAKREGIQKVRLHLFSDGKDGPPKTILKLTKELPTEYIASISGRFFAMDRDQHYDRTEKAYRVMTGEGEPVADWRGAMETFFSEGKFGEEFIEPMVTQSNAGIADKDALVFFNFREDSMRQIVSAFIQKDFMKFKTKVFPDLFIASMTQYSDAYDIPIISPSENVMNPLGKVLAENSKTQLRLAETEKYAHVTYFFNGYHEKPFQNEYRVLVPSKGGVSHADHPEMMSKELTSRAVQAIAEGAFDIIIMNYANADLVAHTGKIDAGVKAVQALDESIGILLKEVLSNNLTMLITSDHGNAEQMIDPLSGEPESQHNISPVPFYLVNKSLARAKSAREAAASEKATIGILADVAPTVLELMKIPQPPEMTGQSLFQYLK